ncbi:hypothetical protein V8G54_001411 [Vigna mungo]|uniref:Uncharacterized protein n=1 Tax=Vigna mungo TaxID=3915 RepID=A0AAQ3P984_VIGMU
MEVISIHEMNAVYEGMLPYKYRGIAMFYRHSTVFCRIDRQNPHRLELLSHCKMSSQNRIRDVLAPITRPPSDSSKSKTSSSGTITIQNALIHTTRPPPKNSTSKPSTTRPN